MNLQTLDTPTLLRHAYAEQDDLTTSDLERELLRRLENLHDEAGGLSGLLKEHEQKAIIEAFEQHNELTNEWDAKELLQVIALLGEHEILHATELKTQLELIAKFRSMANDMAEALPQLINLLNETTKE